MTIAVSTLTPTQRKAPNQSALQRHRSRYSLRSRLKTRRTFIHQKHACLWASEYLRASTPTTADRHSLPTHRSDEQIMAKLYEKFGQYGVVYPKISRKYEPNKPYASRTPGAHLQYTVGLISQVNTV